MAREKYMNVCIKRELAEKLDSLKTDKINSRSKVITHLLNNHYPNPFWLRGK